MNIFINQKALNFLLFMKLFVILIFCTAFFLHAAPGYSQEERIHLTVNNVKISDVLKEIESQTNYLFFYNHTEIGSERTVSLDATDVPLNNLLNQIFKNTDVNYTIVDKHIVLTKNKELANLAAAIQGIVITGIITDGPGDPMPGANVVIKGTTTGVVTGGDGKYSITVPDKNATLVFSFVGYATQEFVVGENRAINVTLVEDTREFEEIVVIGYGTARKKDLTGSVVRTDLSKLQESPNVSIGQSLQGTVPGLNVGAVTQAGTDPSMTIRGRNSISGSTSPLIVLDGIIYRGSLVDINPNDIESIDVLKDASAAAIYGSQATNGVLLITSKSIKGLSKPVIEYSGTFTLQRGANSKDSPMDREEFLKFVSDRWIIESRMQDNLYVKNPNWNIADRLVFAQAITGYNDGTDTNWWDLGTEDNPYIQSHNLSIRGRSELSNYFMSIGLTDQKNLAINDVYKRYNVRMNLDMKITDWLKVGTQTFFVLGDWSGVIATGQSLIPLLASTNPDGSLVTYTHGTSLNPDLTRQQDNLNKRYNIFANFYADVNIPYIKGLNYRLNYSQNMINSKEYGFAPYDNNMNGSGWKNNGSTYNWTLDNILTYKRAFGKHDLNSTLVYGVESREYEYTSASASYFANMSLGYNNLNAGDNTRRSTHSEGWEESSLYMMLRLGYSYDGRYIFTGTLRRDGFSGFGENNKIALFPSAAVAWRLSEENFLKDNANWINDLKLRLSYGVNGNRTVGRYQTLATASFTNGYHYGDGAPAERGVETGSLPNEDLKWETTRSFNVGLDFSVLNSRLFGSLEYYRSNTRDLLYDVNIPRINYNFTSTPTNIGKLANKGIELTLTGIPVQTKDFSWTIGFNFSRNRNEVVSILGIDANGDGKEDDLISSSIFIGKPYGVIYDYELIGMWQIDDWVAGNVPDGFRYGTYKVKDQNNDGAISAANDRKILGYTEPSYRFSIENVLRYKNWELKAFINSIQGGKDYYYGRPASGLPNPDNMTNDNKFVWDYWTPENPNARYQQPGFFPAILDYSYSPYIQRNFIRLQNLTISYRVPSTFLDRIGINNFKVYLTGTNLVTITDYDSWDPETHTTFGGDYPLLKTYSIGINFDF